MIDYVSMDDLQYLIVRALDQQPETVVRDWGLLESALHRPQASVFGSDAYPTLDAKAAALLHSIARNHPLMDGNKPLSWLATRLFYARNELDLRASDPYSADELVRAVASGMYEVEDLAVALSKWVHRLSQ